VAALFGRMTNCSNWVSLRLGTIASISFTHSSNHVRGDKVRAHANGAHLMLLFPSPQADGAELAHVTLESVLPAKRLAAKASMYVGSMDQCQRAESSDFCFFGSLPQQNRER
jgi:hypothetical protein